MPTNRWLDRTQPQTLYMAVMLMYINAAFSLLSLLVYGATPVELVFVVGQVLAGWGIANEKKWAYWLGVVLAVLLLGLTLISFSAGNLLTLVFEIALVALLLHRQSREYRRIWFK